MLRADHHIRQTVIVRKALLILFILIPLLSFGQNKSIPVKICLFNEATAIPFTRFVTLPLHPGIQIGTDHNYRVRGHSRIFQTANISYFYHGHLNQGLGIYSELGYEYRTGVGLALSVCWELAICTLFNNGRVCF